MPMTYSQILHSLCNDFSLRQIMENPTGLIVMESTVKSPVVSGKPLKGRVTGKPTRGLGKRRGKRK
jgi:hypothetical protein